MACRSRSQHSCIAASCASADNASIKRRPSWRCAADSRAASATASAPANAFGSVCVIVVEAATSGASAAVSVMAAPRTAARIAGPLPAEKTPLRRGENPRHSFRIARSVARPSPAGIHSSQPRRLHASCVRKRSTSLPERHSACATRQLCSVSSDTMPRPNAKRCRSGVPNKRAARRRDKASYGKPSASPTAVPSKAPVIGFDCMARKEAAPRTKFRGHSALCRFSGTR